MKAGWLYLMLHIPFFLFVKIGITGNTVKGRADQIDKAVIGFPIPIMAMYLPAVRRFETAFHWLMEPLSARFYRGDGSTEWFWILAGIPVFLIGILYWLFVYYLLVTVFTYG